MAFNYFYEFHYSLIFSLVVLSPARISAETGILQVPTPPPPQVPFEVDSSRVKVNAHAAIIILGFIGTFILIGSIYLFVRHCAEQRRRAIDFTDGGDTSSRRRRRSRGLARGLDPQFIDSFPTFLYSDVKGLKLGAAALECAVCLNEFEDHETLRLLPTCCHVFHPDCIDVWLASQVTCPVCRANLIFTPDEPGRVTLMSHNPAIDSPDHVLHDSAREPNDSDIEITQITNASPDGSNPAQPPIRNRPPRSHSTGRQRIAGKFPRSHSTGHCHTLIRPGDDCERFTLRLPDEVRNRFVNTGLSRNPSLTELAGERSWRKGYRSKSINSLGTGRGRANNLYYERFDGEGTVDRWGSSTRPSGGGGEELTAIPKSLLKSVRAPLGRLFSGGEKDETGERSFTKLMHGNPPV